MSYFINVHKYWLKKEDILIKHSYCPNCNHKLGFFDLFPVFSYIFLGGKCRYCSTLIFPIRYNWTLTKFETL